VLIVICVELTFVLHGQARRFRWAQLDLLHLIFKVSALTSNTEPCRIDFGSPIQSVPSDKTCKEVPLHTE